MGSSYTPNKTVYSYSLKLLSYYITAICVYCIRIRKYYPAVMFILYYINYVSSNPLWPHALAGDVLLLPSGFHAHRGLCLAVP